MLPGSAHGALESCEEGLAQPSSPAVLTLSQRRRAPGNQPVRGAHIEDSGA